MSSITLSMIVKNEERYLDDCLNSVKDVVDEIVIVDTGSTDGTLEIAKKYNSKIFHFDWINDFSAARNFALSKSTCDWILYLDADERLNQKSIKELKRLTSVNKKVGFNCIIDNLDDYENSPKLMKYVRLFKNNSKLCFIGKAHEQIEPSLNENNYKIIDSQIEIIHHGYNVSKNELVLKAKRNLSMLLADYNDFKTSYLAYQIANSYSILEDLEKTVKYFRIALVDKKLRREFKSVCYLHLANYEMRNSNLAEANELIENGLRIDPTHTLLNLIAAQVYEKLNIQSKSLYHSKRAFELNSKRKTKSKNVIDIFVDNKKILFEGILISLKFNSENNLKLFLNNLKQISYKEYDIILNIIGLSDKIEIEKLNEYISDKNLEQILQFLKYNSNIEFKRNLYSALFERFKNYSNFLTNFGSFLLSINQNEEAKTILELALKKEDCEDAVIFYLASIYASNKNIDSLNNLLNTADRRSLNKPLLQNKISLLKEKLQPLFEMHN